MMPDLTQEGKDETNSQQTVNNVTIVRGGIPEVHGSQKSVDDDARNVANWSKDAPEISHTAPRVTRSLTTTGGSKPNSKSCKDKGCDISQTHESTLEDFTHPTRSLIVFTVENHLKNGGGFSVSPATVVHSHDKPCSSSHNDDLKISGNLGNNGKYGPRLNLSNNKVAPSSYERDVIIPIPEGEGAIHCQPSQLSTTSYDSLADVCRICHDNPSKLQLMMPCRCKGSMGMVHMSCLERWLSESGKNTCEICGHEYNTERKPKFTGMSAVVAWIRKPLTPNDTRNFFFDIACFFILTPLAAVSGWLCISGAQSYTIDNRFYSPSPRKFANKSEPSNSTWTAVGLLSLTATVAVAYLVWLFIAIRYHKNVFREWQMRNYIVTIVPFDGSANRPEPIQYATEALPEPGYNRGHAENGNNNEHIAENRNNNESTPNICPTSSNDNPHCAFTVNTLEDELIFASIYEKDSMDRLYDTSPEVALYNHQASVQSYTNRDSEQSSNSSEA